MWLLIYLLIFLLPVAFIGLVMFLIGSTGVRVYRSGRRAFDDLKPYIDKLSDDAKRAQEKGISFADRAQKLSGAVEEIGGRWAFIAETISGTTRSPVIKLADMAGRFAAARPDEP